MLASVTLIKWNFLENNSGSLNHNKQNKNSYGKNYRKVNKRINPENERSEKYFMVVIVMQKYISNKL